MNALYSVDYGNEIRYQPEDVITFSNEFVCNAINKYYEYDIENNNSKCVDLISSLRNIVSNLGDYVVDKKDPTTTPPIILPVICKEYKDENYIVQRKPAKAGLSLFLKLNSCYSIDTGGSTLTLVFFTSTSELITLMPL